VQGISALQKPPGQWCAHCVDGQGCGIYVDRPDECASFYCAWRWWKALGPQWFPAESHLMVILTRETRHLLIKADPAFPDAWKHPLFYDEIKAMARELVPRGFQVAVQTGQHFVFILPDRDVDLGSVAEDENIVFHRDMTPAGPHFRVYKSRI